MSKRVLTFPWQSGDKTTKSVGKPIGCLSCFYVGIPSITSSCCNNTDNLCMNVILGRFHITTFAVEKQ